MRRRVRPRRRFPMAGTSAGTRNTKNGKLSRGRIPPLVTSPLILCTNLPCVASHRFYVNRHTKVSQWEKPTEPAIDPRAPAGPPPSYFPSTTGSPAVPIDSKPNPYDAKSNNPYDAKPNPYDTQSPAGGGAAAAYANTPPPGNFGGSTGGGPGGQEDEDARLARQLQAEEDARMRGTYPTPSPAHSQQSPFPAQLPPRSGGGSSDKAKGLLGKVFGAVSGKKAASSGSHYGQQQYPGGSHGGGGGGLGGALGGLMGRGSHGQHHPQQQYGGGYGGYPQQPGYGAPQHGYGGYPQQQQYYPQQHGHGMYGGGGHHGAYKKPGGGGMGMAGGAALGLGAGVLGGVLVADAIGDAQEDAYQEGFGE